MPLQTKNILFITGAFVGNNCWDDWRTYFESKGYNTIAPPWPHKDGSPAELRNRQSNDLALARLTLNEVIDSYIGHAASFGEKPIVIGHSLGGCMTQVITNRDLSAAGVAIHPVPTLGVIPYEFSFLKAGWKALGLFTSTDRTYMMSFRDWQYAFVNGMPLDIQRAAYEKFIIPESKTVARGGLTSAVKVDYEKEHPPLLITSGTDDTIIPPHLNYRNYKKYKPNNSVLDYKEFAGRNHFVLGQSTWKEDADYIIGWLNKL